MPNERNWEESYKAGKESLPWDTGEPANELVEHFTNLSVLPKQVLEVGCGTGTNAIWMAKQGASVTAIDVSPTAIEMAKKKSKEELTNIAFAVSDIVKALPVDKGSVEFVFDRGVYHVMTSEQRSTFVNRVAESLKEAGYWLCLAGNADQGRDPESPGPPQLRASELVDFIEQKFEIISLKRTSFVLPDGSKHLAWNGLFKKRISLTN